MIDEASPAEPLRRIFTVHTDDPELQAMEVGLAVLLPLTVYGRIRVLGYLADRSAHDRVDRTPIVGTASRLHQKPDE